MTGPLPGRRPITANPPNLPQLKEGLFATDGGLETWLIYQRGITLRHFAAFELLTHPPGLQLLYSYFRRYASIAANYGTGLILESATWRANPDWGMLLGYDRQELAEINSQAIAILRRLKIEYTGHTGPIVISGCVGPRADGYQPGTRMTVNQACAYHDAQVIDFREAGADMISGITMNYVEEAAGLALSAQDAHMPVAISFTVETNGCLPTGQPLQDAIAEVDALTGKAPAYYMINCAHPTHFQDALTGNDGDETWLRRIGGIRANASGKSHAELNNSDHLEDGDPNELAGHYAQLRSRLPNLRVLGGCCGTDHRHVDAIFAACAPTPPRA